MFYHFILKKLPIAHVLPDYRLAPKTVSDAAVECSHWLDLTVCQVGFVNAWLANTDTSPSLLPHTLYSRAAVKLT